MGKLSKDALCAHIIADEYDKALVTVWEDETSADANTPIFW